MAAYEYPCSQPVGGSEHPLSFFFFLSSATSWAPEYPRSKGICSMGKVVWSTKASHAMQANKSSATFRGAKAGQGSHRNALKTCGSKK